MPGGEQTRPEYDESKDQPPPPAEDSAPPPTSSHPGEQTQPAAVVPEVVESTDPGEWLNRFFEWMKSSVNLLPGNPWPQQPTYGAFWDWASAQPGWEEATRQEPSSAGAQRRVSAFLSRLTEQLGGNLPTNFLQHLGDYMLSGVPAGAPAATGTLEYLYGLGWRPTDDEHKRRLNQFVFGEGGDYGPAARSVGSPAGDDNWWKSVFKRVGRSEDIGSVLNRFILEPPLGPGTFQITGEFGDTEDPYPATGHVGIDYGTYQRPVAFYAPWEGEVIAVGIDGGNGLTVRVRHPDGTVSLYAHLSRADVKVGDHVNTRQELGLTGGANGDERDGFSTGWHLHFSVIGTNGQYIDPAEWLARKVEVDSDGIPVQPVSPKDVTEVSPAVNPAQKVTGYNPPPVAPSGPDGRWTSDDAKNAIYYWARQYGYTDSFIQFALAVSYGESGWNPYAVGDRGASFGIWQFYTQGGRGNGYTADQLYDPYFTSQVNLPYLWAAYQRFGGDAGWASNPAYVLKNGWKYGQISIWPTDDQISRALNAIGNDNFVPTDIQPGQTQQQYTPFTPTPMQPPGYDFLSRLLGESGGQVGNSFLERLFGRTDGWRTEPDFLSRLLRGNGTPMLPGGGPGGSPRPDLR